MNSYINGRRLILTAKRDFFNQRRRFLLVPGTILALITLVILIAGRSNALSQELYKGLFLTLLYTGGLICTAGIFQDSHGRQSIHDWLMLPASLLEKYTVRFVFTLLAVPLLCLGTVWLGSLAGGLLNGALYGHSLQLFRPFGGSFLSWSIQGFWFFHALFFLGAAWFRRHQFLKTLLALLLLQIVLGILSGGIGYLIFLRLLREGITGRYGPPDLFFSQRWEATALGRLLSDRDRAVFLGRLLLQGIIPGTCWTAAYFRLREAEIKDGV